MTTTKAYLAALKKSVSQDKLEAMERTLIGETSLSHLTELLRQEVVKLRKTKSPATAHFSACSFGITIGTNGPR